jgi:SsrA-binding protein
MARYNRVMKVVNKQAHFDYELGDRIEAGIVLTGPEVKSVKSGGVDLGAAHVKIRDTGQVDIIGLHIYPYAYAKNEDYDPKHTRKLLLHNKEIVSLESSMKQSRRLLVPTALYIKHGKVKIEIALARGKKKFEKREIIKRQDIDRDMEREFN